MRRRPTKNRKLIGAMIDQDWGVCEFAHAIGVQPTALSMFRSNYRQPTPQVARKIEKRLKARGLFEAPVAAQS